MKGGSHCLILYGDLVRAAKREALIAVAHHWGVGQTTVWKWRKSLGVQRWNEGSTQRERDWAMSRDDARLDRGRAISKSKASLAKMSASKAGKVSAHVVLLDGLKVERLRIAQGLRREVGHSCGDQHHGLVAD